MTMLDIANTRSTVSQTESVVKKVEQRQDELFSSDLYCSDTSANSDSSNSSTSSESPCYSPQTVFIIVDDSTRSNSSASLRTDARKLVSVPVLEQKLKKNVSFGTTAVRFYPIIPGDHPNCMEGPSLTIDWEPIQEIHVPVDYFEEKRPAHRPDDDMRLSGIDRRRLLRASGVSDQGIRDAQRQSLKVRQERERTIARFKFEKWDQVQESIARRVGRTFHPRVVIKTKY